MFCLTTHFCKRLIRSVHTKVNKIHKQKINRSDKYQVLIMLQKKQLKLLTITHHDSKLQVFGSGALGTPASITLVTTCGNYLFNCGEGTQRLCQEHRYKISKIEQIFLTSLSWKNIGGLPGILLSAQASGLRQVNIHGPDGIRDFVNASKNFVQLSEIKTSYPYVTESKSYKDNIMTVTYVPLTKSSQNTEKNKREESQCEENVNGKRVINNEQNVEKRMKYSSHVICYICEIHPRKGKLLIDKCVEYGVDVGPARNMLKNGENIVTENGTFVRREDVCAPDGPKTTFIVVECPEKDYVDTLVNNSLFSKYQQLTEAEHKNEVTCVFHFTPENILNDPKYQDWIQKFSKRTEHVIINEKNTCMGSNAVYKYQYQMNMLHPEIFPLLSKEFHINEEQVQNGSIYRARALQTLKLRPECEKLFTSSIYQNEKSYIEEVFKQSNFEQALKELKTNIEKKTAELNLNNTPSYPRIVMLGTGCSVPSKVRNTSSILLRITEDSSILLDCGEGTLNQMIRFYGLSEYQNILRTIKAIYVSHMHADHQLGVIGLLEERAKITSDKLYLLLPTPVIIWLNFYNNQLKFISQQYIIMNNFDLMINNDYNMSFVSKKTMFDNLNIKNIETCFVPHCKHSYGVAVTLKDNTKIVYSGDTMFSKQLVNLGKDCDLLIHEATMEDGLESLAKAKFHSTTSEAVNVGKFMNAKFTLLTHFSQRYSKIPALPENEPKVGLAYDNMQFTLPQLPLLPLFYPCLEIMYSDYNKVKGKNN